MTRRDRGTTEAQGDADETPPAGVFRFGKFRAGVPDEELSPRETVERELGPDRWKASATRS
jgi:hypothetical protein